MIVILTEAGFRVGLGHLTRMRSLKNQLEADEYAVRMIIHLENDCESSALRLERGEMPKSWINDRELVQSEVTKNDIVVVDTYSTTEAFMKELADHCAKLVAIDDYKRICYTNCVVVNPNYYGAFVDYPEGNGCEYRLGSKYTLVRPEFGVIKRRDNRQFVQRILITFGGTDVMNLTPDMIRYCHSIAPDASLDVVVTSSFTNLDAIKEALGGNDALFCDVGAKQMNALMNEADFAIASAGSTSNELFKAQCPSIMIQVAENQSETMKYLVPLGYFKAFDRNSFEKIEEMLDVNVRKDIHGKLMSLESESSAKDLIEQIHDRFAVCGAN